MESISKLIDSKTIINFDIAKLQNINKYFGFGISDINLLKINQVLFDYELLKTLRLENNLLQLNIYYELLKAFKLNKSNDFKKNFKFQRIKNELMEKIKKIFKLLGNNQIEEKEYQDYIYEKYCYGFKKSPENISFKIQRIFINILSEYENYLDSFD